ncbi:MAG TPA: hypothetical protein VGL40_08000 [Bacillota bacterium]
MLMGLVAGLAIGLLVGFVGADMLRTLAGTRALEADPFPASVAAAAPGPVPDPPAPSPPPRPGGRDIARQIDRAMARACAGCDAREVAEALASSEKLTHTRWPRKRRK